MTAHKPFGTLTKRLPAARKARIDDKAAALHTALALHELRKARAVSQAQLARKLAVGQPAVAKIERRSDMYVSNLRRYVEALGGTLEISARFHDGAVTITQETSIVANHHQGRLRRRLGQAQDDAEGAGRQVRSHPAKPVQIDAAATAQTGRHGAVPAAAKVRGRVYGSVGQFGIRHRLHVRIDAQQQTRR
ncbi:MAG: helix-turn-helix transcriptional regulator [Rhizobiales bacterium]|nr:helix-turn-helix transcriptional regulator [Hyphomicrobiales bacterium]